MAQEIHSTSPFRAVRVNRRMTGSVTHDYDPFEVLQETEAGRLASVVCDLREALLILRNQNNELHQENQKLRETNDLLAVDNEFLVELAKEHGATEIFTIH